MYPSKTREMTYQIIEKGMYRDVLGTYLYVPFYDPEVCTRYILFSSSMYSKTYFFVEYVLKNIHFFYQFEPGTYRYILEEKKYVPSTYFGKKVCTRYKPVYFRLYRYHTIAWDIPVCTGMYSVHTIVHDSR